MIVILMVSFKHPEFESSGAKVSSILSSTIQIALAFLEEKAIELGRPLRLFVSAPWTPDGIGIGLDLTSGPFEHVCGNNFISWNLVRPDIHVLTVTRCIEEHFGHVSHIRNIPTSKAGVEVFLKGKGARHICDLRDIPALNFSVYQHYIVVRDISRRIGIVPIEV
mmetsp:Transcript_9046/g.19535  ORF Transcript_9046/g.19535 Transcript_9046/m.19535 type:complete len:165 (-) Transcript_9046:310-804(-)